MVRTIKKVGNSHALILDRTLMDLAHLHPGAEVNVTVREEGTIMIEPIRKSINSDRAKSLTRSLLGSNDELFRRLAE